MLLFAGFRSRETFGALAFRSAPSRVILSLRFHSNFSQRPSLRSSSAKLKDNRNDVLPPSGWRSLEFYPKWTAETPTNHVGCTGVMSPILQFPSGAELEKSGSTKESEDRHNHTRFPPQSLHTEFSLPSQPSSGKNKLVDASAGGGTNLGVGSNVSSSMVERSVKKPLKQKRNRKACGKHSGVQREILFLFRGFLKALVTLEDESTKHNLKSHIRSKFDEGARVDRRKLDAIEWWLNYGKRKLEELERLDKKAKFHVFR